MHRYTHMSNSDYATIDQVQECADAMVPLIAEGQFDQAELVVDRMARRCQGTSCKAFYHSLVSTCGKADGPRSALWCALKMVRVGFKANVVTFNNLLQSCVSCGHVNWANDFWTQMLEVGVSPNAISYHAMLNTCVNANDLRLAEKWLIHMHSNEMVTTTAVNIVIFAFAREGSCAKAERWFRWMQEAGVDQDHTTYNAMIQACLKARRLAEAEHWIAAMCRRGLRPDLQAYNGIIVARAEAGAVHQAELWRQEMESQNYYPSEATVNLLAAAKRAQLTDRRTQVSEDAASLGSGGEASTTCHNSETGSRHSQAAATMQCRPIPLAGPWSEGPGRGREEVVNGLRRCARGPEDVHEAEAHPQNTGSSSSCEAADVGLGSQAASSSSGCQRAEPPPVCFDIAPADSMSSSSDSYIRAMSTNPQAASSSRDCQRVGLKDINPSDPDGDARAKVITPTEDEIPCTRLHYCLPSASEVCEQRSSHLAENQRYRLSPWRAVGPANDSSVLRFQRLSL